MSGPRAEFVIRSGASIDRVIGLVDAGHGRPPTGTVQLASTGGLESSVHSVICENADSGRGRGSGGATDLARARLVARFRARPPSAG